jgi:hypothetical protein
MGSSNIQSAKQEASDKRTIDAEVCEKQETRTGQQSSKKRSRNSSDDSPGDSSGMTLHSDSATPSKLKASSRGRGAEKKSLRKDAGSLGLGGVKDLSGAPNWLETTEETIKLRDVRHLMETYHDLVQTHPTKIAASLQLGGEVVGTGDWVRVQGGPLVMA